MECIFPFVWNVHVLGELGKTSIKESNETKKRGWKSNNKRAENIEQVYKLQSSK